MSAEVVRTADRKGPGTPFVADFVMEIGLDSGLYTYSGGLGTLAGDMAFSFADLGIPSVFVTILYKKGYVSQKLDKTYGQADSESPFDPGRFLTPLENRVEVQIRGMRRTVGAWEYRARGKIDVPIIFLDTDLPDNDAETRGITASLYGGNQWTRLMQEMVLGVGGYRMLRSLGYPVDVYHINESHSALVTLELLRDHRTVEEVRKRCVFTAHTSVQAAREAFPLWMLKQAYENDEGINLDAEARGETVDFSGLAMKYSAVTNAVSLKHRFVCRALLNSDVEYVTNGVYHRRWIHPQMRRLYDRYLPGWEETPALLGGALGIPTEEFRAAHHAAKSEMLQSVKDLTGEGFLADRLTIGAARRATSYKRNGLILSDLERLVELAEKRGPIQVVLAGRAHPKDEVGKVIIRDILERIESLKKTTNLVNACFLENYDIDMAKALVGGCDLWLNTPRNHLEASGTSGMKAAMNGLLNLSVYDGWWVEGGFEGVNGWGIGKKELWTDFREESGFDEALELYGKLSDVVVPLYYGEKERWWRMAQTSVALAGPHFNSYRMAEEYFARVYRKAWAASREPQVGKPNPEDFERYRMRAIRE
jgi:glycogen phosphorylase